jgi:hypothetical protein
MKEISKHLKTIMLLGSMALVDSGEPQDENHIVIKDSPSTGTEEAEKAQWKSTSGKPF